MDSQNPVANKILEFCSTEDLLQLAESSRELSGLAEKVERVFICKMLKKQLGPLFAKSKFHPKSKFIDENDSDILIIFDDDDVGRFVITISIKAVGYVDLTQSHEDLTKRKFTLYYTSKQVFLNMTNAVFEYRCFTLEDLIQWVTVKRYRHINEVIVAKSFSVKPGTDVSGQSGLTFHTSTS